MVKAIKTNVLKKLIPKLKFHQKSSLLAEEDENSKSIIGLTVTTVFTLSLLAVLDCYIVL